MRRSLLVTAIAYGPPLGASLLAVFGFVHDFRWEPWYCLALVFGLPATWILLCARVLRHVRASLVVTAAMLVLAYPLVVWGSHQLRRVGCRLAAARMQPLAHAIERCLAETRQLPTHLEDLVPRHLTAMPARVPRPYLLTGEPGQPWTLVASFFDGLCDGYDVIYLPAGIDAQHRQCEGIGGNWVLSRF